MKTIYYLLLFIVISTTRTFAGDAELKQYACKGDLQGISEEVKNGTIPTIHHLDCALLYKHSEATRLLVNLGVNINAPIYQKNTLLIEYAKNVDPYYVQQLLALKANPNLSGEEEKYPIHLAVGANFESVKNLIKAKALIDAKDASGFTPLNYAIRIQSFRMDSVINYLIDQGASTKGKDPESKEPFSYMVINRITKEETIARFFKPGFDIGFKNDEGFTHLHKAANAALSNTVSTLLQLGLKPSLAKYNSTVSSLWVGQTYYTTHAEDMDVITKLLAAGDDINAHSEYRYDVLTMYARSGMSFRTFEEYKTMINFLLTKGAILNNNNGTAKAVSSALDVFSYKKDWEKIRFLIEEKAAVVGPDALAVAMERYVEEDEEGTYEPLPIKYMNYLLTHKVDVNATSSIGYTPLCRAASSTYEKVLTLIDAGGDVNAECNPLKFAVECGDRCLKNTKLLVKKGADLSKGYLLHSATQGRDLKTMEYLISLGFKVNDPEWVGKTSLHIAAADRNIEVGNDWEKRKSDTIRFLMRRGAKNNIPNNYGQTPCDFTREEKFKSLMNCPL